MKLKYDYLNATRLLKELTKLLNTGDRRKQAAKVAAKFPHVKVHKDGRITLGKLK